MFARIVPLAAACIVLGVATPASAHELFLRVGSVWITDPSYDLFAEQDASPLVLIGGGLGLDEAVAVELAWGFTGGTSTVFQAVDTSFSMHQFQGAVRWDLLGQGSFRTALRGAANFLVGLASIDQGVPLKSTALGLGLDGTVLAEFHVPIGRGNRDSSWAFSMETGWGWNALPLSFERARIGDGTIDQPGIELGELDVSGPILRFGMGVRF